MTIIESLERQLEVVQDSINEWLDLAVKHKNNKSVSKAISNQIERLYRKFNQINESLQLMKAGKHFTDKGWV